jgi:hypothetical protein
MTAIRTATSRTDALRPRLPRCGNSPIPAASLILCFLGQLPPAFCSAQTWEYPVNTGDTLIGIAQRYFDAPENWRELQKINNVRNPRRLQPHRSLTVPVEWLKRESLQGKVLAVTGRVEAQRPNRAATPVSPGLSLAQGTRLRIPTDASATLALPDGSTVLLLSNSSVTLNELTKRVGSGDTTTLIQVDRGRIETRVVPLKKQASKYEIQTPVANMGVRGTDFRVAFDPNTAAARTEVLAGAVNANNALGAVELSHGEGTVVEADKAPQSPIAILPAPNLAPVTARVERLPIRFRWENMDGANAYRVLFAHNDRFDTIVSEGVFKEPESKFADLPDGRYVIRVRAIDQHGLEGRTSKSKPDRSHPSCNPLRTRKSFVANDQSSRGRRC